ncbi:MULTISPECIES: hypothetical protein [Brevundimonas]|uniref:hypothetical protein n=1 Tax=Brevundimonas pishanensis TaxID=2896315 RepID=UPI001FA7BF05|nr:hypothetical protein [Brevundimonas pishanensis]
MTTPIMDGAGIGALVSMMMVLVMWVMILRNKRAQDDELDRKLLERQERIDAERARHTSEPAPQPDEKEKAGPWG